MATMNVPAHIAARAAARQQAGTKSAVMAAVVSGDGYAFPKISIRASRYRLVEDGVETPVGVNLDVVIVGANPNISKIFYGKPFDGSDNVRPDCFSNDGIKPDGSVLTPVSTSCASCPHNVLGSRMTPSGAKSKMCADQRHLAVVPAADPNKVYAFTVSVSAMKNLREYFKELQNYGLAPEEVVTELGFDDTASFPKVTFKHKGFVPEKLLGKVDELVASEDVKEAVRLIAPRSAGPALAAPAAAAAALPKPSVDDAYEEEPAAAAAPAPAKTTKPKAAPAPAPAEAEPEGDAVAQGEPLTASALEAKLDSLFSDD